MNDADKFWETVKRLSREKSLRQEDICRECDFPISTFRHWIGVSRYPDAKQTLKLADLLGVSVEYLVLGEDSNSYKAKYESLVAAIKKLPLS